MNMADLQFTDNTVDILEHLVDPGEEPGRPLALLHILPSAQLRLFSQLTLNHKRLLEEFKT